MLSVAAGFLATALLPAGCTRHGVPVTAVGELAALSSPAVLCEPPRGVSDMESTYDRRGGNADWWDVPPPLPGTTNLYEALRIEGPGCLKRIWQTSVHATEWQFLFDGESEPRLRGSPAELFGTNTSERLICNSASGGCYFYLPLPFAKSLRVLIRMPEFKEERNRPYLHFNYERYPAGTAVETWPQQPDAALSNAIARANAAWDRPGAEATEIVRRQNWRRVALPAQQAAELLRADGQGTVTAFCVRPDFRGQNAVMRSLLLRSLVLECYWDGAADPSVRVPLGDFFCNGLHPRQFASLPLANVEGAYLCRLPMPFRRGARVMLRNDGPVEVTVETAAEVASGDPGDRLYLHASFHDALGTASPFRVMETSGRGKYVGCYLVSLGMDGSWNILEGDEYFYRDGGKEFVHHGTGVEDYFNGGWYYFGLFERPLHGLLEKAAMRTAQYRFHLTDPVTFRKDLRMEWDVGGGSGCPAAGYFSAASFWYQDRPGPSGSVLPPVEKRFPALDRLGLVTIMCELFELERMGLIAEAAERCEFYAGALAGQPEAAVLRLRALACREMLEGHAAVRGEIAALAAATNLLPETVRQAQLLLWRGERPGRAIFGAHAFGDCRLLVDGRLVGEGGGPQAWRAWPVELTPGEHLLEAEVTPRHAQAFFSAGFSSFFTNVVSDASWDYLAVPAQNGTGAVWRSYDNVPSFFPTMAWWAFEPNAFPCVQSGRQEGGPCDGWTEPVGRTVRLRRRIVVPEVCGDCPPLPPRITLMPSLAVRPKDDTSNEGISHGRP